MKCLNIDADCKYQLKVTMLDGSEMDYEITDETQTEDLLDLVFKQLDLNENIFFGLYNLSNDDRKNWLVNNRKISRQITINSSKSIPRLYFGIKFYIDDPCKLKDESSRYQFFLQIKKDILDGKLDIPFDLSANLFAYALQSKFYPEKSSAELGDYDSEMHKNNYASNYKFQPNQTRKLEEKAEELHKNLIGKMPATVEFNFLEEVKHLELYGTILYPIMTDEDEENYLALSPTGVMILHRNSLFAHYNWSNIIGVYKKGKYFMIKVFNKDNEKTTYGFELANKKLCKNLWKTCVEYQLFYKLIQAYYENNPSNTTANQNQLDELTQRFRSINLNKLMVNRRKTISSIFQYLIQHINSLNKNSSPKDHLKTDQLAGINFTADEIYQDNHDLDEVENEKTKSNVNHQEKLRHELNKNELESTNLPNGFYLVNQQLTNTSVQANNNKLVSSENKTNTVLQNTLNKRKPLNTYISTPGYNVEPTNILPTTRNRKCESVFSVRSQRSRAAYSEMAYSENNRHNHKHHKNCSHKRNKEHRHRKSSCSHRHKDYYSKYEDECNDILSFDEFEESIKHHHHHGRKNRSRSYHTLCDDIDHKYFNEQEIDNCCKKRNRHSNRSRRRRHRSCCLNELRYDSEQEEDEEFFSNNQDENVSLCSSIHSLNNSKEHCKRKHKNKESNSRLSLKVEKEDNDKINEIKPIIKNASFKNLKLIDCDELAERENEDNQSDISDALSYCSHHSRKSKHSKNCHRSRSNCRHGSRSRCKHHYHRTDSYTDLLDRKHYERSSSSRKRNKNLSCESLSEDEIEQHQINEQKQHKLINNDNKDKLYRSNNDTTQSLINAHTNQQHQQYMQKSQQHQPKTDYHFNQKIQKTNNQYLLPPQQFSNQYAYDYNNQTIQDNMIPKYNTINYNYRPPPINEQHQLHQIQNHQNFVPHNYLPNYSTMTTNIMKPIQYNQQIGLPNVYQLNNQFKTNNINNGMYLTSSNNIPNNLSSIPAQIKTEHQLANDKNIKQQQVYQNLQDYLKDMPRFNNPNSSSDVVPQLPPRNNLLTKNLNQIQPPPIPSSKPSSNPIVNKLNSNVKNYKTQLLEDNTLYAKPNKLINKNELNQNMENQLNEDIVKQTQNSINSGDSANSSLQNINLDSGISICSTSTPTNDLRYSNVNKSNEQNNKKNDEIITNNGLVDGNLKQNNNDNQNENSQNNYESNNQLNNEDQKLNTQKINKNQSNQQQNKPLEYYEINADFNSTAIRSTAAFSNAEYPAAPKLKCYEISTEL